MKISIITFHCAHNYGAVLQAYALQEQLKLLGHNVSILDYRPDYLVAPYKLWNKSRYQGTIQENIKAFIVDLMTLFRRVVKYYRFEQFISKCLTLSSGANNISSDVIVVGSDQIWSYRFTKFDPMYFGLIDNNKRTPIIAYAASMEGYSLSTDQINIFKDLISNIDSISVREASLKKFVSEMSNKVVTHVLDPTLLIDKKCWQCFVRPHMSDDKYVLIYDMKNVSNIKTYAENISRHINCRILQINPIVHKEWRRGVKQTSSPAEFIRLFANASYVVTTSFHGTAFAIIFNIPFVTIKCNDHKESRLLSLLDSLSLNSRLVDSVNFDVNLEIDWTVVNRKLSDLKKISTDFINTSLNAISK